MSRSWMLLMPLWLWLSLASGVQADTTQVVLWLDHGDGDSRAWEQGLRLELQSHAILLMTAAPQTADAATVAAQSRAELARSALARTGADAVLWLEADADRPLSWLRVIRKGEDSIQQAPLPSPPAAIEPGLFAVAAASLLDQLLHAPTVDVGPGTEPPTAMPVTPAAVAAPTSNAAAAAPKIRKAPQAAPVLAQSTAADWFAQLGVALPFAYVGSGMEASSRPPAGEIFIVSNGEFFFDDSSAWIPDADSFDDFADPAAGIARGVTPLSEICGADGIVTMAGETPSKFCARLTTPGFAFVPALRLTLGRWVLPRLALAVLYQGHFGIEPESFFGNQLFGLQGEYLAVGARGRGMTLSVLAGLTAGRTETPVPPTPAGGRSPNVLSSPVGAHVGVSARLWLARRLALFASPTFGLRFPVSQTTFDLSLGMEVPF